MYWKIYAQGVNNNNNYIVIERIRKHLYRELPIWRLVKYFLEHPSDDNTIGEQILYRVTYRVNICIL